MTTKALLAAAVVLVIALSPSVTECIEASQNGSPHAWLHWGWIALAAVVAVAFGETLIHGKGA